MESKIILWTEDLSTGIIWQDYQHREFLNITNELIKTFFEKKGRIEIDKTLVYLDKYAINHLVTEELYMKKLVYPNFDAHFAQHQIFRSFVDEMKEVATNKVSEGARICNKLNNWFVEHIKVTDTKLGAFLSTNSQK